MQIIAQRVSQLRKQRRMSQLSLSVQIGISQESISSIETGKSIPKLETLVNLAKHLDCSLDYLVGLSDVKHPALMQSLNDVHEQRLISNLRKCSSSDRNKLLMISTILAKDKLEIEINGNTVIAKNFLDIE